MCDIIQVQEQLVTLATSDGDLDKVYSDEASIEDMPVEIILSICSYLDPYFLRNTMSKVCRRFADILADDHLWKHWIHSKIKGCFPTLLDLKLVDKDQINWEDVCIDMDVEKRRWSDVKATMRHIVVKDFHFASVDTVLLVNKGELCISGGRDRSMALWNVPDIMTPNDKSDNTVTHSNAKAMHTIPDAHSGWVWDLASDDLDSATKVFSASWDNTVKVWDLEAGFKCIETFKCDMSALSVIHTDNIVMAGLYSKKILSFDLRTGPGEINAYKAHRGPVLALHTYKNMVASISEDKTLAIWDKVAGKLVAHDVKIPTDKAYPVCINWTPTALYVGDSKGCLHLMHPENHVHVKSHEIWPEPAVIRPSSKITTCYQSSGNLILCSDRGEIKFFYNCYPPQEYTNVIASNLDVTQMRYQNGVMVIGTCDSALEFWIPNDRYQEEN